MLDLTTKYLGLTLKNPIIAASSGLTGTIEGIKELEKNGASAIVLKSIFEEEILQEYKDELESMDAFESNLEYLDYYDYQLKDESLNKYVKLIEGTKKEVHIPIIASINCSTSAEWSNYAKKLQEAGADAIELNIFILPSDLQKTGNEIESIYFDIIEKVLKKVDIPVSVKISYYFSNVLKMVQRLSKTGISGIVLFNRFYSPDFDIEKLSVTSTNVFSTKEELSNTLRWIAIASPHLDCNLAASTGVHDGVSVIKQLLAGADAVQIATTLYKNGPTQINNMLKTLEEWMDSKSYASINQFKGKLSHSKTKNAADLERVQFMKYFSDRQE